MQTPAILITGLSTAAVAGNLFISTTPASELQLYNTAVGTVSSTNASPAQAFAANYWATGGVTGLDYWTIQSSLTAGLNGASTLTFAHTGSTGSAAVQVPLLDIGGTDTGISRLAGASLAIGNGTQGDFTGSLTLASETITSASATPLTITSSYAGTSVIGFTTSNSGGVAKINLVNNLGSAFAAEILGSSGVGSLSNCAFIFTQDGSSTIPHMAFATNGGLASGGTTPIHFSAGGYNATPQLTLVPGTIALLAIGGTGGLYGGNFVLDTGISRLAGASLAIGNGTASDTTGNLSFNKVIKYAGVATVKAGIGSIVASTAVTGKTAAITATTLYAVPSSGAGMYKVSWTAWITTAAAASSTLGGTNGFQTVSTVGGVAVTDSPTTPTISALNTTATKISGVLICQCDASTNLQYAFGYTDGTAVMTYSLNAYVEYLG
jgi:hypothetical protein